jgi:predicted methyltransferase
MSSQLASFSRRSPDRRALALGTAFAALAALAACGSSSSPGPAAPEPAPPPEPAATPVEAAPREITDLTVSPELRALVDAADRTPEDKKLDAGRKPAELLAFAGIKPGMKVAELAAGPGYTSEILARAVAPSGVVYAENNKMMLGFLGKKWDARLARPAMKGVVRVDRELEDPLPPEAKDLDAVFMVLFYHDLYWAKTDRARMNAAVLAALKPGGVFIIIDHSGRDGTGETEVQSLHRIEESVVRDDITRAGFKLVETASFLRNPDDKRDWNASPMAAADRRGSSDRFALKFQKPAQ